MKTKLVLTECVGLAFCFIMSFVLHFIFEWCGGSPYIAWLGAVNESVWEHGKILFYPYLIYSIIEYFILKPSNINNYLTAKCIPLLFAIPLMATIFYTYSGIIGTNYLIMDILTALIVLVLMFLFSFNALNKGYTLKHSYILLILVIILTILIIVFTYYPPKIALFYDFAHKRYSF